MTRRPVRGAVARGSLHRRCAAAGARGRSRPLCGGPACACTIQARPPGVDAHARADARGPATPCAAVDPVTGAWHARATQPTDCARGLHASRTLPSAVDRLSSRVWEESRWPTSPGSG